MLGEINADLIKKQAEDIGITEERLDPTGWRSYEGIVNFYGIRVPSLERSHSAHVGLIEQLADIADARMIKNVILPAMAQGPVHWVEVVALRGGAWMVNPDQETSLYSRLQQAQPEKFRRTVVPTVQTRHAKPESNEIVYNLAFPPSRRYC